MSYQEHAMQGAQPRAESHVSGPAVGFIVFAGVVMAVSGVFQVIQGLAAVIQPDFYVLARSYAFDMSTNAWGWLHIVIGSIVTIAGFAIFSGAMWARLVGIAIAVISMISNFVFMPYYPVWAIMIIALDIGVIWALAAHGHDMANSVDASQ